MIVNDVVKPSLLLPRHNGSFPPKILVCKENICVSARSRPRSCTLTWHRCTAAGC